MTSLLTIQDVRRILKCSRTYVYQLIDRGDLRVVKLGRLTRIIDADIERFLADTVRGRDDNGSSGNSPVATPGAIEVVGRQLRRPTRRRSTTSMPVDQPWLLQPNRRDSGGG